MSRRIGLLIALAWGGVACSDPERPGEEHRPDPIAPSPPTATEHPEPEPEEDRAPAADLPPAPESGCAMGEPVRVHAGGWAGVAALADGFVVAGTAREGQGELAFVLRVGADGSPAIVARGALEHGVPADHRRSVPAVAAAGERVAIAIVDGQHRVLAAELDAGSRGAELALVPVGASASFRFAPALARAGDAWALAWTDERDDAMRVRAGLFANGALRAERQLVPDAGGSAAATFVRGGREPVLVFLDPRAGVSVAHRSRAGGSGFADPTIARPINLVTEPPELAAVRAGSREWLAYTAVGSAATTAVGLLPLEGAAPAVALVPGTGYGVLHADAATLGDDRAVFVADAPQGSTPDSPRELHVRVLNASGELGEPAVVRGPSGSAARGRIAHAGDGTIAVTFSEGDGVYLSIGRCALR